MTTAYIMSDHQYPATDMPLVWTSLEIVRDLKPDVIVVAGDGLDFEELGRYKHNANLAGTASLHVNGYHKDVLKPFTEAAQHTGVISGTGWEAYTNPRRIYLMGNHERRYNDYQQYNAAALGDWPSFQTFAKLEDWEVFPYARGDGWWPLPNLLVSHGWQARSVAAMTARANSLDLPGVNVITGHTHRIGQYAQTYNQGGQRTTVWSYEMGHMADESSLPKAMPETNNWQQCAGVILRYGDWGFHAEVLPVVGNKLDRVYVGGNEYRIER
jgi:hypothetical protein